VHVAKEMERLGCSVPLLIGGATTSKAHTAVKIAPAYSNAVVHVLDASRAVGVVGQLINPELKPAFAQSLRAEYDKLRQQHAGQKAKPLLTIEEARRRRTPIVWNAADISKPAFTGLRMLASDSHGARPSSGAAHSHALGAGSKSDALRCPEPAAPEDGRAPLRPSPITLSELVPYIDWSPFFHTWELRGRYPAIIQEQPEARKLFEDAQQLLQDIVRRNLLTARGVYGFFPANAVGDDVELYSGDSRLGVLATFHFLRQQMEKPPDQHNHCLADYIAPKTVGGSERLADYIGAFAVSVGFGTEELCKRFEQDHDDYNSIMTKALADRLAEAFAEYLHQRARRDWGFGQAENLTHEDLIREKYRGIRPAAGYPASPDHTEKWTLWKLLDVERTTGIKLTESCAMWPGASVSGLYFAHPEAKYFGVGKVGQDQVLDYHLRKQMDLRDVERWLGPYLNYEPDNASPAQPFENRPPSAPAACSCGRPHAVAASQA
jgi:5-methyltetrahydrofolate--homocysteine methyltransferase